MKYLLTILYSIVALGLPTPRIEYAHTRIVYLTDVFSSFTVQERRNWWREKKIERWKVWEKGEKKSERRIVLYIKEGIINQKRHGIMLERECERERWDIEKGAKFTN